MGQKVNPNGFRVGVIRDWNTRWYANKKDFSNFLVEDKKIRDYLKNKYFGRHCEDRYRPRCKQGHCQHPHRSPRYAHRQRRRRR